MRDTKRISNSIRQYTYLDSPIGSLLLAGDNETIMLINFPHGSQARKPDGEWIRDDNRFLIAKQQLNEYFAGIRTKFSIAMELDGTEFQKLAWTALQDIPFGSTLSYGELARRIGRPKASRAVGAANHANPVPIIIPCHRVIGADKSLTGFGGGLETKQWLLELEKRHCGQSEGCIQTDLFTAASH